MAVVQICLSVVAAAVAFIVNVSATRTLNCTQGISGSEYIADDADICVYYHCRNGLPTDEWPATCAKGTRLPSYFNKSFDNPCSETVSRSLCLRCDYHDIRRTPDVVTDYCSLWTPCDAGCVCHNEVQGYWCECSGQLSTLPALPAFTTQCSNPAYCLNGGTCYKLHDADPFCDCVPGWTGKQCERKLCDWNPCVNGVCVFNGTQIYCQCERCYRGSCCEIRRTEDPDCNGCGPCEGGLTCKGNRDWLCKCNKCPDGFICADAGLNQVRFCDRGAATAGSRFTLMFQENFETVNSGDAPKKALELYIAAGQADNGTRTVIVSAPRAAAGCSFSERIVIQPLAIARINVSTPCRHDGTGLQNNGILVQEINNDTVTVFGINRAANSADSFLVLPDSRAGRAFVTICYPTKRHSNDTDHASQFAIVATEDDTMVNITLSSASDIVDSNMQQSRQDHTYIVTLNARQTYQVQSTTLPAGYSIEANGSLDLSGTIITSSKPIHVFSGNVRTSVLVQRNKTGTLSTDHLVEEVPPAETWGSTFAIVPIPRDVLGYKRTLELIRLVASFDTNCTLHSSTEKKIYPFSTYDDWIKEFPINASDNYLLDCTGPVLIMEITESANESIENKTLLYNDPSMIYVPAVTQYTNYYVFAPPTYSQTGGPYGTTLVVLAAISTVYQHIEVDHVTTTALPQFKPWRRIAPLLPASDTSGGQPMYGGIVIVPNNNTSVIRHPDLQASFMCLIYCYDNRESVGHVAGSKLAITNDLQGTGRSQWQYAKERPIHFIN